ncbi:MAG: DMT family transporter [Clostridia bacterium]|nr:DMT family transporter [Clostridia bacterium]
MQKHKTLLCSLLVMLLWGLLFPTVKLGYRVFGIGETGDILLFAGVRFLVCGLVITAFALLRNPAALRPLKKCWPWVLLAGLFAIILHYSCTYLGLSLTDGSKTAILKQLGAVFYICFSALFFPEDKLTWRKLLGLALGLSGILAINTGAAGLSISVGDLLIIAASFCTVFSNVVSKKVFRVAEPLITTGISQLFGGIVLLGVGLLAGGKPAAVLPATADQFGIFGLIVAASAVSYCLWFLIVQRENLSGLFIVKFIEPLFAALFAWLLLGEDIFKLQYPIALLLITAGVAIGKKSQGES